MEIISANNERQTEKRKVIQLEATNRSFGTPPTEFSDYRLNIVNATAPSASTDLLQGCPEPSIGWKGRRRRKIRPSRSLGQNLFAFGGRESPCAFAHEINASGQVATIDHDTNPITVAKLP